MNIIQEIEIKVKVSEGEDLFQKALDMSGVELKEKEGLERDVMYDDGKGFYDFPKVLRLRTTNHGNFLTYKEKNEDSDKDSFLVRTELETEVKNGEITDLILRKLGFTPYRVKEKQRREIKIDNIVVEFHKMPFLGEFIEIEGAKPEIENILKKLDIDLERGINKDYSHLFYEYCDSMNLPRETPMTFEEESKHLQK
jgi:predicted adenylyl cyclase CyaB